MPPEVSAGATVGGTSRRAPESWSPTGGAAHGGVATGASPLRRCRI